MSFDPSQFMSQPSAPMATSFENVMEGEYIFMLDTEIEFKEIKWQDKNTGADRSAPIAQLQLIMQDAGKGAAEKARLQRDVVKVRCDVSLDLDSNGQLDVGPNKNVLLGQLRDALGQNTPGWTFGQLKGAGPVVGKVSHRADKNDPSKKYVEVKKFAKVS